jgi:tRNA/rRNA methyltransferase
VDLDLLRVVLVSPRNPLNIGAAARAMSNFDFSTMRLVNPYDVAFREARSAVGAAHVLTGAREYPSVAEAVADCTLVVGTTAVSGRELLHPLKRLEHGARLIRKRLASGPVALLFGSEKFGLSNEDLSHCHWLMRIPSREAHSSMNLGQAVAVCLYELVREPRAAGTKPEARRPAAVGVVENFTALLLEVLEQSGYVHAHVEASTEMKVRRLVRRLGLSAHDAEIWLGILRQIRWRLDSGRVT